MLRRNKYPGVIKCLHCMTVLVSNFTHDFNSCNCFNKTFIDGGYEYLRYGGMDLNKIQVLQLRKVQNVKSNKRKLTRHSR